MTTRRLTMMFVMLLGAAVASDAQQTDTLITPQTGTVAFSPVASSRRCRSNR